MSGCGEASPLVTFGVVTDVQFADCDDRPASYDKKKTRFYRQSLDHVEKAFDSWKKSLRPVSFALQLGDIIDGVNVATGGSHSALMKTLAKFESHDSIPTFHTVGNHELYNFKRHELAQYFHQSIQKMNIPPEVLSVENPVSCEDHLPSPVLYYKFSPNPYFKFISLDCFDISVLGYDQQHPAYRKAADVLESHHKHNDFDLWDSDGPLKGLDIRFQQMNGAVGNEQLLWLEKELMDSDRKGQKVIVFGHVSLSPDSTDWSCLLWNYEEVMECFHRHHSVVAYLSGHSHNQGYAADTHGIHYVVFSGIIETPPEDSSFATVHLHSDKMEIIGHGIEKSYLLKFPVHHHKNKGNETVVSSSSFSIKVEV